METLLSSDKCSILKSDKKQCELEREVETNIILKYLLPIVWIVCYATEILTQHALSTKPSQT